VSHAGAYGVPMAPRPTEATSQKPSSATASTAWTRAS
jgi:hypothetical protein